MIIAGLLRTKIKILTLQDTVDDFGESTDEFTTFMTTWAELVNVDVDRIDTDNPKMTKRITLKIRNRDQLVALSDNLQLKILTGDHIDTYEVKTVQRQQDECIFTIENYGKV